MNKNVILFNLVEAKKVLDRTIKELETDFEYGEPELSVAMMHLSHHVNTAWNARDSTSGGVGDPMKTLIAMGLLTYRS